MCLKLYKYSAETVILRSSNYFLCMMGKDIVFDDDYYVVDYVNSVYVEIVQDSLGRKLLENEFDIANDVLLCAGLKVVKLS